MSDVISYLLGRGLAFLVLPHPGAVTPADTARAHGIDLAEIVRTEVVTHAAGSCLMVVPNPRYLDLDLSQAALRDPTARPASHAEVRVLAPTCDIGALPPLSLYLMAPMYVDPAVADRPQLVFPAGRASVLVVVQRAELFRDDPYVVAPLTRESSIHEVIAPSRRSLLAEDGLLPVHLAAGGGSPGDDA